jgi:hypothetical protein
MPKLTAVPEGEERRLVLRVEPLVPDLQPLGVGDVEGRHRAPATASARAGLRHQFDSGYRGHQRVLVVRQREAGDVAAFAGGLVAEYDGDVRRLGQRRRRNRIRPGVVFHFGVRRFGANRLQR